MVTDAIHPEPAAGPTLDALGWTPALADAQAEHTASGRLPARVVAEDRGSYQVLGPAGEQRASVTGRFRHETSDPAAFPAVGDWVAIEGGRTGGKTGDTIIHAVLPRRSALRRGPPKSDVAKRTFDERSRVFLRTKWS